MDKVAIKQKIKKLKKEQKNMIKKIHKDNKNYLNFKIRKAKKRLFYVELVMYITGLLILVALPFTLIEAFDVKGNSAYYLFLLSENIILVISPIFFGFCLFKIFEWNREYQELIEKNIAYNIDFIKIINWQFKNLLRTINEFFDKKENEKKNTKELLDEQYRELIHNELDELVNYINEYSHFNSEKFEQEIILILQREWFMMINNVNFVKKSTKKKSDAKIKELNNRITFLNEENLNGYYNEEVEVKSEDMEYERIYNFSASLRKMNDILAILKKFLNCTYRSEASYFEKQQYKKIIKYYVSIINYDDIAHISNHIFFNLYEYKIKLKKVKKIAKNSDKLKNKK